MRIAIMISRNKCACDRCGWQPVGCYSSMVSPCVLSCCCMPPQRNTEHEQQEALVADEHRCVDCS